MDENKFLYIYNQKIKPKVKKFESKRILYAFLSIFSMTAALILLITTVAFGDYVDKYLGKYWALLYLFEFIILMLSGMIYAYFQVNFESKLKNVIMPILCECIGNIQWSHAAQLFSNDTTLIIKSRLLPPELNIKLDDTFSGITKKGNWFKISEVILKNNQVFIFLKFKGKNYANTILIPKGEFLCYYMLRKIHLEDVKLDKVYDIYTDDEVEARYLLNPSLMEKISNLEKTYGGKRASLSFFDNNLVIKITTYNDAFNIGGLFTSVNNASQFLGLYKEILAVQELVEYFEN